MADFLRTLSGPIVLVGHSYGGNVISTAAIGNEQVRALVYFNGWMCDEGESQQLLLDKFEGSLVDPSMRPVPFTKPDGSQGTDLYLVPEAFREAFAADVDPETAAVMAAAQRPYAAAFAATPSAPPAWNTVPCWYLLGTEDKAIPPELQRFMAERTNATIVEVSASHVSFVPARSGDPTHPAGRRGDRRSRLTSGSALRRHAAVSRVRAATEDQPAHLLVEVALGEVRRRTRSQPSTIASRSSFSVTLAS